MSFINNVNKPNCYTNLHLIESNMQVNDPSELGQEPHVNIGQFVDPLVRVSILHAGSHNKWSFISWILQFLKI